MKTKTPKAQRAGHRRSTVAQSHAPPKARKASEVMRDLSKVRSLLGCIIRSVDEPVLDGQPEIDFGDLAQMALDKVDNAIDWLDALDLMARRKQGGGIRGRRFAPEQRRR